MTGKRANLIDAPIIMAIITIFAILTWWFTPEDRWLSKQLIKHALEGSGDEVVKSGDDSRMDVN